MSLHDHQTLSGALERAKKKALSTQEFQILVLQGLVSLKESHVSLRSRLFNLETESALPTVASVRVGSTMSAKSTPDEELRKVRGKFDFTAVKLYQDYFYRECGSERSCLTFAQACDLLTRMDFKYYGDGRYPLSHYLRETIGDRSTVNFANFLQAISISVSRPIPLGYKAGFEDMDLDSNGKLDAKEVFNMMRQSSDTVCYSWADVEDFLAVVDLDQDGKMDYAEMLRSFYFNDQ